MRAPPESDSEGLVRASQGKSSAAISAAMADLNRSGLCVDEFGNLHLDGYSVALRIRQGVPCALVEGARIEWSQFRTILPRRAA